MNPAAIFFSACIKGERKTPVLDANIGMGCVITRPPDFVFHKWFGEMSKITFYYYYGIKLILNDF